MLKLTRLDDANKYYQRVENYLLHQEAINCLILGISKGLCHRQRVSESAYLAVVENSESILATAIQTPSRKLILATSNHKEAVEFIAQDLASDRQSLPGVIAPKLEAKTFIDIWKRLTKQSCKLDVAMRIHQLKTVQALYYAKGKLRLAKENDRYLLTDWGEAFEREALGDNEPKSNQQLWFDRHLENKSLFVWQDKTPVSMAASVGATPNGIRINAVYTPPEYRGRGYATSCVSQLSRQLRDRYRYCFLFTNLANPTSNHIYRKIGFTPMCDVNNYSFIA